MNGSWKHKTRARFGPLVGLLVERGVTPNQLTVCGLLLAVVAGVLAAAGRLRPSAACLILSSLCDLLDGQVARRSRRAGPAGAFLDSCLDRLAEGSVFLGLILHFGAAGSPFMVTATGLALIGSFLVSYARARAEGLGIDCQVGLMERPERLLLLIVVLAIGGRVLAGGMLLLAVLSIVTFIQRLRHVVRRAGVPRAGACEESVPPGPPA